MEKCLSQCKKWHEKIRKKIVYDFNILKDYHDEWDNFQSQVQEYTKKHEKNGWENIIINEINLNANNPPKMRYLLIPQKLNYMI
jgi:hypothetical protein